SKSSKSLPRTLRLGEGLVGQCALEKKRILLEDVPPDYIRINSVLGSGRPANVVIMPVLFEGEVKAVIELASFGKFSEAHLSFLEQLMDSIGVVFNTIEANMRTEDLLEQSQSLTKELQSQQEELKMTNDRLEQQAGNLQHSESLLKKQQDELRSTNEELQEKARLLSEQMRQVEYKNREVEQARSALEEKAEQLALSSRYKSEFLANMSHELRTPLNSLLILAKMLADNNASNLTGKQIEYAQTIHAAGADLLSLINDILDLAKIESGTITLNIAPERFIDLNDYVTRGFRQVAQDKNLAFNVDVDPSLPAMIQTDSKRLQQILKNLLPNAFKFTEQGSVNLRVYRAKSGWTRGHDQLDDADGVVAFSVTDTGIGIPDVKQKIIFEAFQQADGTTSRRFGGTGLGLSISRELTRLLGGDLRVHSEPGKGSTFTLFLPFVHAFTEAAAEDHLHARKVSETKLAAVEASESLAHKKQRAAPPAPPVQAPELKGRKVLIIDDDARNIFALTGALQERGIIVLNAEDGKKGLEVLRAERGIDLVLMDIMMPELDGYDMIRIMRGQEELKNLPIIAVTAKAMKGDREKCIAAGASDYIAKPVSVDDLLSLMRVWLLR